ncbi:DMT family transporter [Undibacterium pigrum]|uniref:Threonine/homoserine efflux transporter RhtA n=1 Tax=Undibacterium pigrum TaxID=401470 RepID=A0A318JMD2_9BURK|nr:DMT family transporter [Undibacterium pigrum]PXX45121.1 threonine/homoserine efflux transporter RhtA [Undibacterium pigrum]
MRSVDLLRLISLAAIWGASFLFMRVLAPVVGVLWSAEVRVGLAGIALLIMMYVTGRAMNFRDNWKSFLILGTINSALPFALYSYAALSIPAGYSAIVNATSPLWGAVMGAAFLGERLTVRKMAGMAIGVLGVAFLVRLGPVEFTSKLVLAVLACVGATLCYAIVGIYTKKKLTGITPMQMATGSQVGAAFVLLPFLPLAPVQGEITATIAMVGIALALLCSAVAYLIYFRLMADLGPTKALTVTFLIPLFALLWGYLFLNEHITVNTAIGCAGVVLATWLVVFQPAQKPA